MNIYSALQTDTEGLVLLHQDTSTVASAEYIFVRFQLFMG